MAKVREVWPSLVLDLDWAFCVLEVNFKAVIFIFRSHQMYFMFGFLFLVFIILLITCSEATVLLCYFHLCAEVKT